MRFCPNTSITSPTVHRAQSGLQLQLMDLHQHIISLKSIIYITVHSSHSTVYRFGQNIMACIHHYGLPGGSVVKNLPANAGDAGSVPELGQSPGVGNGNPLQDYYLDKSMDRGGGGVQSKGAQRVRHDWAHTHACIHHYSIIQCSFIALKIPYAPLIYPSNPGQPIVSTVLPFPGCHIFGIYTVF